jgi:hypothetical protein
VKKNPHTRFGAPISVVVSPVAGRGPHTSLDEYLETDLGKEIDARLKDLAAVKALDAVAGGNADHRDELRRACIVAEQYRREFLDQMEAMRKLPGYLDSVDDAIEKIEEFTDKIVAEPQPKTLVVNRVIPKPADKQAVRAALRVLNSWIAASRVLPATMAALLGATRKASTSQAAETAAIGWLSERVEGITGKPHHASVGVIATHALATSETVSEDRVRKARDNRRGGPLDPRRSA